MPALTPKEIAYAEEFMDLRNIDFLDRIGVTDKVARREAFLNAVDDDARRVILKEHIAEISLPRWIEKKEKLVERAVELNSLITIAQNYIS